MYAPDIQRVIVAQLLLDDRNRDVGEEGRTDTHEECPGSIYKTAGGRDRNQSGNRPGNDAQHRGLAVAHPLDERPDQPGSRSRHVGNHEGSGCNAVCCELRAGVKAEPAHPEHTGTQHGKGQVVRGRNFLRVSLALAEDDRRHQGGNPRVDMDHGTPGKVECTVRTQVEETFGTPAPDPVAYRAVNDQQPDGGENTERTELQALGIGPEDQRGRDDGKHALEGREKDMRDRPPGCFHANALEHRHARVADETTIPAKGKAVADHDPEHGHQAHAHETLHEHGQHVLAPDEAAVEKGEAGGHQQDQSGRHDHPGGIAGINLGRRFSNHRRCGIRRRCVNHCRCGFLRD